MEFKKKVTEISKIVGKTATDTYNTVADKSGKLIADAKLKIAISDKETDIEKIYEDMGKSIYELYKNGEEVNKDFVKECKKVDKLQKEINQMNTTILYNKGLRVCEKCESIIPTEASFCGNCGQKQKPVKIKEEKKETKKEETKVVEKVCPQCGLVCSSNSKFCTKCGYKFDK